MRSVAVLGIGKTKIDEHWEFSLKELAGFAAFEAMNDAGLSGVEGLFIGNMMSGLVSRQENLGALMADWIGLPGIEAIKVEAACGSGGAAFRAGWINVASGAMDSALVIGVEKMTESLPIETTAALATAADADWEAAQGLSFVALNALVMQRYMHETGWKKEHFAPFSINAHRNALGNPDARLHVKISMEDYKKARAIAEPINLLDASPIGDGAAAVLIVPAERVDPEKRVCLIGSGAATDTIGVFSRRDPTWLRAAELSSKQAYQHAGITPADIDFFELHDAFSIMAALSLEASGFADRGQGPRLGLDDDILPGRKLPIATRGGLKARGHPVGATGVYQIVEVVQQLRRTAGDNQLDRARIGMAQNIGGSGATILTHIFQAG